jgi:integrase
MICSCFILKNETDSLPRVNTSSKKISEKHPARRAERLSQVRTRSPPQLSGQTAIGTKALARLFLRQKVASRADKWEQALKRYAYPVIGDKPVGAIDKTQIHRVLAPVWQRIPETADRIRLQIESVLHFAKSLDYRDGDNPATWRGNLEYAYTKADCDNHHAALPYKEISTLMQALDRKGTTAARALQFVILTAARSNEVFGAKWGEIDLVEKIWTVPAARMKAGKVHKVPLSAPAIALLGHMRAAKAGDYVFPGRGLDKPLDASTCRLMLKSMGLGHATVHGLRSAFRDWAAEETHYPNHVVEMALAHGIGSAVEAAYRRGDLMEKRKLLMADWANYADGATG